MLSFLELKIPPVAVIIVFVTLMAAISWLLPGLHWPIAGHLIGAVTLAVLGGTVSLAGVIAFQQHRTTVNPRTPEAATTVVSTGVYQFTRNPMYVGFITGLTGWAVFLSNVGAALLVPVCVLYLTQFQIKPEERALLKTLGAPFADYMSSVRRWL